MKHPCPAFVLPALLLPVVLLLAGCNWVRWLEFRRQLTDLPEYTRWEEHPWGSTLVFHKPLLRLEDLRELRLSPTRRDDDLFTVRYRYAVNGVASGRTEVLFWIENDKLRGVSFPAIVLAMFGQANLEALLRMTGDNASAHAGPRNLDKARILHAIYGPDKTPADARRVKIVFTPEDHTSAEIEILFEEDSRPGLYSSLSLRIDAARSGVRPAS